MLGSAVGDIVGSIYEARPIKTKDFPLFGTGARFTDDTVCSVAVAHWLLDGGDVAGALRRYVRAYPDAGFGGMFLAWGLADDRPPYGSWGNGAAMRAGPVGHTGPDMATVLSRAATSARCTHDHPDAVKGAEAAAAAVRLAVEGRHPPTIRALITERFGYDLSRSVDAIREGYAFDISCAGTVPPALVAALEAADFEDAVRNAVSLGGDSDTLACIAGAVAEPLHRIPRPIAEAARSRLDDRLNGIIDRFEGRFGHYVSG